MNQQAQPSVMIKSHLAFYSDRVDSIEETA
jgi:hypothetical protein